MLALITNGILLLKKKKSTPLCQEGARVFELIHIDCCNNKLLNCLNQTIKQMLLNEQNDS